MTLFGLICDYVFLDTPLSLVGFWIAAVKLMKDNGQSWKHHALWGGIILTLIIGFCVTLNGVFYFMVGVTSGAGIMMGFGRGALLLGATLSHADSGVESGYEEVVSDEGLLYWFRLEQDILYIPIWFLVLLPLGMWVFSIFRKSVV